MKKNSVIKIGVLTVIAVISVAIIFLLQKNSPNLQHEKYIDTELGFEIDYPKGWKFEKDNTPGTSGDKYVKFSGEIKRQKKYDLSGVIMTNFQPL